MATNRIPIVSPLKGVIRAVNREGQPPESCWDAQNMVPYDRYGRKRVAQRGGALRQYSTRIGHNSGDGFGWVQNLIEAPNIVYPGQEVFTPLSDALPGWPGSFSTIGTFGPYTNADPPNVTLFFQWEFKFTIAPSGFNTGTDDTNYASEVDFYFPVIHGDPTKAVILSMFGGVGNINGAHPNLFASSSRLFYGDPMNPPGWSEISAGALGSNWAAGPWDWDLKINSAGVVNLTNVTDSLTSGNQSIPYGPNQTPPLNVLAVFINGDNDTTPPSTIYQANLGFTGFGGF